MLHVPDTADRYYVNQFIDAWSNNFAYVGQRATGTAEGDYLLVERGYNGKLPTGMQVIHAPTGLFLILGRLQVNGKADLPAVHALQDQFTLTPLSARASAASIRSRHPAVGCGSVPPAARHETRIGVARRAGFVHHYWPAAGEMPAEEPGKTTMARPGAGVGYALQ